MNKNKCNPPQGKICIYCWNSLVFASLAGLKDSESTQCRCKPAANTTSTICQMWQRRLADGLGNKLLLTFQDQTHHHAVKSDMWWSSRMKLVRQKVKKNKKKHNGAGVALRKNRLLLLPLTSVSWVCSSAIFRSYIIFLSDTMAIRLKRISPSLYLQVRGGGGDNLSMKERKLTAAAASAKWTV